MHRVAVIIFILSVAVIGWYMGAAVDGLLTDVFFTEVLNKAKNGNAREQLRLAQMYETGKFIDRDREKAYIWYVKAAKNGNIVAKEILNNH